MKKTLSILLIMIFILSTNVFSEEATMESLIKEYPELEKEIRLNYRAEFDYSVDGFSVTDDVIGFQNFGLDKKRDGSTNEFTYEDVLSRGQERNLLLSNTGWAHCFAMSFLTKQFFDHGNFSTAISSDNIKRLIEDISKKKNRDIPGENLWKFSRKYKKDMKKVLEPLQKKLFFNLSSIGLLFGSDQKKAYKEIRDTIKSDNLCLIGLKKSLTWQHVVVGYRAIKRGNDVYIYIYDSNYPYVSDDINNDYITKRPKYIRYDISKKKFRSSSYGDIKVFKIYR
ncbi:MAG: hypothetical protein C0601_11045 [Candidatus Muiribacterium halophilum]|uniref:Peptidase C39-like domain-containing protein n=1 Tax=Muiribacterium halophilum TaxID=2053465 RepID=A0A2N5ZBV0_MUIH1|nr:MAG: hypothetical protein C0601_11045 [Candidatus Muirbacterium halophilum]